MTKAEIVAQISQAERNRENGCDDCGGIIHGKCKRVNGCGKRGVLARIR